MIWDIMYELLLFGERAVVRAADALLAATHGRGAPLGNTHGIRLLVRERPTGS